MARCFPVLGFLLLALPAGGRGEEAGKPPSPGTANPGRAPLRQALQPFLEKHCTGCHGGEKPKAGISFENRGEELSVRRDPKTWEKALAALRAGKMPPKSRPAPDAPELKAAIAWLEAEFSSLDPNGPLDPGRPIIRRLNRTEYNNTIRDLLAIDLKPADDFPSDDLGYGFDNIGDVLSLPPLLMEKYLMAAEKIVERAIVAEPVTLPVLTRHEADFLKATGPTGPAVKNGVILLPGAEIRAKPEIAEEGDYLLRVRASGRKGGAGPIRIALKIDGREIATHELKAVDGVFQVFEARERLKAGTRRFQVAFLAGGGAEKPAEKKDQKKDQKTAKAKQDPKKPTRFLTVEYLSVEGPMDAKPKPLPESHRRIMICVPDEKNRLACARKILESFARRAWRRPVAREEADRLVRLISPALRGKESFERAIQPALQAVLASPHFIFKVEIDRGTPGSVSAVSDHELAVRLSYFLWSSMPDDDLFVLADRGELRVPRVLDAQVERMLDDPRAKALTENFAGQWLQVRNLKSASPDPGRFPTFDEKLRADMVRETELFFEAVLRDNRSILEFLECDSTFLNERLARHYGVPGVKGEEFRRVKLPGPARGGVITQASILTITSNPTRTSPVKRGKWILEEILGSPPPPPPPGVDDLNESPQAVQAASLRERMDQHRRKADCASCHERMDALGFGLENYDAIGAWRESDGKFPVDASGTLPGGQRFQGPGELKAILLREREAFTRNLAEKVLIFALGRGLEYHDRRAVEGVTRVVMADGFRMRTLIREVVRSTPFQMRKAPARSD